MTLTASDVALIEDPEELEVYGTSAQATKQVTSYSFEVIKRIILCVTSYHLSLLFLIICYQSVFGMFFMY